LILQGNNAFGAFPLLLKGGMKMGVKNVGEKYRCNVCGNEVTVTKVGGGTLVCCEQEMELIGS
jgi:desulfoferrodoxin-like iron-binding protein